MRTQFLCLALTIGLACPHASAQWVRQPFPSDEVLYRVRFVDSSNGWVLGERNVYKTTDAGASWTRKDTVLNPGSTALFALSSAVAFFPESTGIELWGIRKTTDGGATWRTVDSAPVLYNDIEFVSAQIGYAAGGIYPYEPSTNSCVIRKTTDGGDTWSTVAALDAGIDFEAVSFIDPQRGWAISWRDGLVFHTTDGGVSWTFQDSVGKLPNGQTRPMRDIEFTTADSGWAVGGIAGTSVIARTTNGGTTWTVKGQDPGNSLLEIAMANSRVGWIIGRYYTLPVLRTTDGGETWIEQAPSPPVQNYEVVSISAINENLGWFVCTKGIVYRTTNGGAVGVDENQVLLPEHAQLEQNYPNPFNPSTRIRYELPRSSVVRLIVFDMLGREVAALVNELREAGIHEVSFDGSGLASGVYLYRLNAGSFTQTRKLILMK